MRVLLTGATGFLGYRVLRELLARGCQVRCAVRTGSDLRRIQHLADTRSNAVQIVTTKLSCEESCSRALRGCDVVYHVAAALQGSVSSLVANTVIPTRTILRAAADHCTQRCVLVSSLGVYGTQKLPPHSTLDETCPRDNAPHLRDPYSYSKILQEETALEVAAETDVSLVILRPGVIYGEERGLLCGRVGLQMGNVLLRMGRRHRVPCTFVDNCASAVALAGLVDTAPGEIINILDNELPTSHEILSHYQRVGKSPRVIGIPQVAISSLALFNEWYSRWSQGQIPAVLTRHRAQAMWKPLNYTNQKARKLLGWRPTVTLETALQRTLNYGA